MKEEIPGQGSAFINRLGNELLAAPMYLMYLCIALLGMWCLDRFVPGVAFHTLDYAFVGLGFVLFCSVGAYLSLGSNYHDIIVQEEKISIVNRVPGFRRQVDLPLADIEEVVVTESHIDLERPRVAGILRETFHHPERKWVEIRARGRRFRWNCYGINDGIARDGSPVSTLEELVRCLKQDRNIPVRVVRAHAA